MIGPTCMAISPLSRRWFPTDHPARRKSSFNPAHSPTGQRAWCQARGHLTSCAALQCRSQRRGPRIFRSDLLVKRFDDGDVEPGAGDHLHDRPGQMTTAEESAVNWLESTLPSADLLIRRQSVFDEMKCAARTQNSAHLA